MKKKSLVERLSSSSNQQRQIKTLRKDLKIAAVDAKVRTPDAQPSQPTFQGIRQGAESSMASTFSTFRQALERSSSAKTDISPPQESAAPSSPFPGIRLMKVTSERSIDEMAEVRTLFSFFFLFTPFPDHSSDFLFR